MAIGQEHVLRVSYSELSLWPDDGRRYELYDGEVRVVPSPLPLHQVVAMNIEDCLRHHPRTSGGFTAAAPLDIVFDEYTVIQPDVVYFERERLDRLSATSAIRVPPDLAVEILSAGTASVDRGKKLRALETFGVREYWLVDPGTKQLEIFENTGRAFRAPRLLTGTDALVSPLLGPLQISVEQFFVSPIR